MKKNPKLAAVIILGAVLLGLAFNFFFMWKVPGISLVLYFLLIVGFVQIVKFYRDGSWKLHEAEAAYIPLFFVTLVPFLSQNYTLSTLAVLLTWAGTLYVTIMVFWNIKLTLFSYLEMLVLSFFHQVIQIGYFFKPFVELTGVKVKSSTASQTSKVAAKIAIGIIAALPILLCFFILFISADAAFNQVFSLNFDEIMKFLSWDRVWEIVVWFVVAVWLIGGFAAACYYKFNRGDDTRTITRILDPIIATVISVLVNLLFLCFVIVQFVYLFAGEDNIKKLGITYSDYARQGFFELLAAAAISLLVVYSLRRFGSFRSAVNNAVLQFSLILQVVFSLVVLYSAYYRMTLYEKAYALTDVRFFVYVFLFFLVAVLLYTFAVILSRRALQLFSLVTFVMACAAMFIMGLVNPDAYVAKANIAKYNSGQTLVKTLDTDYLITSLSSDAYVHLLDLQQVTQDKDTMCNIARVWLAEGTHRSTFQETNLYRLNNKDKIDAAIKDYVKDGKVDATKCSTRPVVYY